MHINYQLRTNGTVVHSNILTLEIAKRFISESLRFQFSIFFLLKDSVKVQCPQKFHYGRILCCDKDTKG